MRRLGTFIFVLLFLTQSAFAADTSGGRITKCKDANGVWHYGDYSADKCADDSDVTELNEQGVKVRVDEAVPDARENRQFLEISKRKQQIQRKEQEARSRDLRLLAMYESVEDMESDRDERLAYIRGIISANQEILSTLHSQHSDLTSRYSQQATTKIEVDIENTEQNIELYERVIANRMREIQEITIRFDADIERYRRLITTKDSDGTALTSE